MARRPAQALRGGKSRPRVGPRWGSGWVGMGELGAQGRGAGGAAGVARSSRLPREATNRRLLRELGVPESVELSVLVEHDARDACERERAFSLRPCHGWSLRSPSHTCSTFGVFGVHGVRGCVGDAADCRRAAGGGV